MTCACQSKQIHLFVQNLGSNPGGVSPVNEQPPLTPFKLELPSEPVFLIASAGEPPRLQYHQPDSMTDVALLEPLPGVTGGPPRLLVINSVSLQTRLNAELAPRVAIAHAKDVFQFNNHYAFHVSIYHRPRTGSPRAESVGVKSCPLCSLQLEAGSIILECVNCAAELHNEGDGKLDCANLAPNCPSCSMPLIRTESHSYIPEI